MDSNGPRRGLHAPEQRQQTASTQSVSPVATTTSPARPSVKARKPEDSRSIVKWIAMAVALLAIIVLGWFGWQQFGSTGLIDQGKYQAVFLTNGQVYFGKLQNNRGDYLVLENIFYLQAANAAANESQNPQETEEGRSSNDVQLIKLGTEVHGPTDEMMISREQVLFFENLKEDSSVSKSIKEYYEKNN